MRTDELGLVPLRWRSEVLEWSDGWPKAGLVMPSGRRRTCFKLLRALMGLADMARSDGSLKGPHSDYWTREQLAKAMKLDRKAAGDTLAWLEQNGRLITLRGALTTEGREPNVRRLVPLEALGSNRNSDVTLRAMGSETPTLGVRNANPRGHATLEPRGDGEVDPDPNPLIPLSSLNPLERAKARGQAERLRAQITNLAHRKAM